MYEALDLFFYLIIWSWMGKPLNFVQSHSTPLTQKLCLCEIWAIRMLRGEPTWFKHIFTWYLTLTLNIETVFKITAHSLFNDTLWFSLKTDWREYIIRTRMFYIILWWPYPIPRNYLGANHLLTRFLWIKFETDCANVQNKSSRTERRTNKHTDRLVTIGRPQSGTLMKWQNFILCIWVLLFYWFRCNYF